MHEKRVNPDTGLIEEKGCCGWEPARNDNGHEERVNSDTGVREEKGCCGWEPARNDNGHEERVNSDTGMREEKGCCGWEPARNDNGHEVRVNSETGFLETKGCFGWETEGKSNDKFYGRPRPGFSRQSNSAGIDPALTGSNGNDSDSNYNYQPIEPTDSNSTAAGEAREMDGDAEDEIEAEDSCGAFRVGADGYVYLDVSDALENKEGKQVQYLRDGRVQMRKISGNSTGFTITTTTFESRKEYKSYLRRLNFCKPD